METGTTRGNKMIQARLLSEIRAGDQDEIANILEAEWVSGNSAINVRDLVQEAIRVGQPKCLDAILARVGNITSLPDDASTPLGDACLRYFNESVIQVLVYRGVTNIARVEVKELIQNVLDNVNVAQVRTTEAETNNPPRLHLSRLRFILTTLKESDSDIHGKVLGVCGIEEIERFTHDSRFKWLFSYVRYGVLEADDKTTLALQQMESKQWEEARATIGLISEKSDLDKSVKVFEPVLKTCTRLRLISSAVMKNRKELVELLISKGANVEGWCHVMEDGEECARTSFQLAVDRDLTEICQLLVNGGVKTGWSSKGLAGNVMLNGIIHGNLEILKFIFRKTSKATLIEYRNELPELQPDEIKRNNIGYSLDYFIRYGKMNKLTDAFIAMEEENWESASEIIKEMSPDELDCAVNVSVEPNRGSWNLMLFAVAKNNVFIVTQLVNNGADVNNTMRANMPVDEEGILSPLELAVRTNNVKMVHLLLDRGAKAIVVLFPELGIDTLDDVLSSWVAVFTTRNSEILKLLVQYSDDPGEAFTEYITRCMNENTRNLFDISDVFSLDVLNIIFGHGLIISKHSWTTLIVEVSRCNDDDEIRREKQNFLKLLLNYLPAIPKNLLYVLDIVHFYEESPYDIIGMEENEEFSWHMHTWLINYSKKFPSLQKLSRFVVRQSCSPCSSDVISSLGLPSVLEDYIQHPLQK